MFNKKCKVPHITPEGRGVHISLSTLGCNYKSTIIWYKNRLLFIIKVTYTYVNFQFVLSWTLWTIWYFFIHFHNRKNLYLQYTEKVRRYINQRNKVSILIQRTSRSFIGIPRKICRFRVVGMGYTALQAPSATLLSEQMLKQ